MAIAQIMGEAVKQRVLVCDDETSFVRLLEINLQRVGLEVVTATDGQDAFDKAQSEKPALMLVDLFMPCMDGFELVKKIREDVDLADLPIIVLTADMLEEDHERVSDAGADEVLTKPVEMRSLMDTVKRFVTI